MNLLHSAVAILLAAAGWAADTGRVTQAVLGTGVTRDSDIINPTTVFATDTPKIFCAWKVDGLKAPTAIRGAWVAEDVGKAAPPNYKIDEATILMSAPGKGQFSLSKPNKGFPAGKYRLEIYVGAQLTKTVPFTVRPR